MNITSTFLSFTTLHDWPFSSIAEILFSPTKPTTAILLLLSLFFFLSRNKRLKRRQIPLLPPGPSPWPLIGNIPELLRNRPTFRWILSLMKEMNTEIVCIKLARTYVIAVSCPEIGRQFLKKHDAVFASRPITMSSEYSSRGFLSIATAPLGEQWKKMRRVVASEVLNAARIRWLLGKRTEEADNLVRYVYNRCKSSNDNVGAVMDLRILTQQYAGNVIRKLMFNRRYFGNGRFDGGPGVEELEHVEALFLVLQHLYVFSITDYMPYLRWLDLDGHGKIIKKAIAVINKYHDPIIEDRIKKWRSGKDECHNKEPEDLLDVLLMVKDADGKPMLTLEEVKAEAADLVYASIDNASNAIEWVLAEMINHPELLEKAVEEVDQVVGKERLVQESDIPRLNYIKACAKEAFRLHPFVPFNLPHVSTSDVVVAGYFIPKDSHVLLTRMGWNPKVWDDPLKYIPERHLKESEGNVELTENDLRFISFSTGRRGCMGMPLGSAMTIMLLARLVQGFTWSAPPGESKIDLTESKNSMCMAKALQAYAQPRLPSNIYPAT